jgi:uncharacterized protein
MEQTTKIGIYHKNCTDGTTAAAVLLRKFPDIKLFPLVHSHTEDEVAHIHKVAGEDNEIYFVDFAVGVEEFLDKGHEITVLDHHISMKEEMEKLADGDEKLTYVFDNDKSGASLSWSYFFPDEKEPEIIKYVEDSDLWTKKYEDTKYVTSFLSTNADTPEKMLEFIENVDIEEIKKKGKMITDYSDIQINRIVESAESINLKIGELVVPAYNLTSGEYVSVIGNKLSTLHNKPAIIFSIKSHSVKFSIRSLDGQSPNALGFAKMLGGGGHENSAGAEIPLSDFIKMIIL